MLFVILVLSLVLPAVLPRKGAFSVHLVVDPVAGEGSLIGPLVGSLALDVVIMKLSFIHRPVFPRKLPQSILLTVLVIPLVPRSIRPNLHALALLNIPLPFTFILGPIEMDVDAMALGLVIDPFSLVNVTVSGSDVPCR